MVFLKMLKPQQMTKLSITGTKKIMPTVIDELHSMNVLHIIEHRESHDISIGSPLESADVLSEVLVNVDSLISILKISRKEPYKKPEIKKSSLNIGATVEQIRQKVNKKKDHLNDVHDMLSKIREKKSCLETLCSLPLPLDAYEEYKSISLFVGTMKKTGSVDELDAELKNITNRFELYKSIDKKNMLIALFIENSKKQEALELLQKHGFSEIDTACARSLRGNPALEIIKLKREEEKLVSEETGLQKELENERERWAGFLLLSSGFLKMDLEKAEAPLSFAATKNAFVVTGWVPRKRFPIVKAVLLKNTDNKIHIETEEIDWPKEESEVPVELDNPKMSRPFEFFIDLYALPKYREFDPTMFIFFGFPLLFGFMLGDFGYGLVTMALFYFLKKVIPSLRRLLNVMMFASGATIVFGLLFGEFFGAEELFGISLPHILSRSHQYMVLLLIAVIIGFVHINWGLIVGFLNKKRTHGLKHAVFAKLSWVGAFNSGALLIVHVFDIKAVFAIFSAEAFTPLFVITLYIIFALSVVALVIGEGVIGLIELPGIFSNLLSYARLMALGLASVKLAEVINEYAGNFFAGGGINILYAVLLLVVGHAINIALGTIGPFLHSLRLHYVEFYTKFFSGGGKRYVPFGASEES